MSYCAHVAYSQHTHNKVLLRWAVQQGIPVIPKSTNPTRLAENLKLFDFELNNEQMQALNGLDRNFRYGLGWMKGQYLV